MNNRGVAERVTSHLNDLAGAEIARPHHGSLSKEKRRDVEEALKSGQLKAIVATSSLELGIDMGSIDLVVQIGSPKSVARGLQRIGRAGHSLGEPSSGRILPTFRSELIESAVLAREMHQANVEETRVPRNCLDVLAQQVCAMAAVDEWSAPELFELVRRAHPYRELTRAALDGVLEMLSGRYPSTEFGELRPRIAWDRARDRIRARDGSRMLAIVNGGTIPDRGYFGVYLAENGVKLGELDEEMVYESRAGDVFILGNRNWRIEAIGHDRVLVSPAPPGPARLPFWHGDAPGRPYVLGDLIARFLGEAEAQLDDPALPARLERECDLDELATANLVEFLDDQRSWAGGLPSPDKLIVERFADELGEPRMVIHSPFGKRVNGAWALALVGRLRQTLGMDVEYVYTDDGIALRFPPSAEPPRDLIKAVSSDNVEDLLVEELANSAMFGAVFRENAARSLLLPRQVPNRRSPLWLQRIKAADLLQVARRYDSFPVVIETYRECLQDILDVENLRLLLSRIETGEIRLAEVDTDRPSPFAAELLFSFVAAFMYASDAPRAERTSAMLSLNRDLLSEVLDSKAMRELLDPAAIRQLEGRLQRTLPGWKADSADDLMEIFLRLVDLSEQDVADRCEGNASALLGELVDGGQVVRVSVPGSGVSGPGSRVSGPGSGVSGPGSRVPSPGARGQGPGAGSGEQDLATDGGGARTLAD
ncbi:MAG: DEAD/DEAH box helicase, partial [Chloroflexota bacterium]|nr:DEAD/DEAH box helicase [Chloroflexota bacterium]